MTDISRLFVPPLYPILDASFPAAWPASEAVSALARAGCRIVQLRGKELSSRALYEWAREASEAAGQLDVALLVNDRADVALMVRAAGVHLGQDDLSPSSARRILGPDALIGLSTHSLEQAREADSDPIDYVAIGPVYPTGSKPSTNTLLGPEGVARVREVVSKPLVAIGGIKRDNGRRVLDAGADALAVISALLKPGDLETAARELIEAWKG